MRITDPNLKVKIDLRNEAIKEKIKDPSEKSKLISNISKRIDLFRGETGTQINNSDSAISKIIFKSIDNDSLFDMNLKRFADDIPNDPTLFKNMLDMYALKALTSDQAVNKERFNNDSSNTLAFIDFDRHRAELSESFARDVGENISLGKETKVKNMIVMGEISKFKFFEVLLNEDIKEFKDSLTPDCLYNNIKDLDLTEKTKVLSEALKNPNIPEYDVRNAFIGVRIDEFVDKYKNGGLEKSFSANVFPTFEIKYRQYSNEFDDSIKDNRPLLSVDPKETLKNKISF